MRIVRVERRQNIYVRAPGTAPAQFILIRAHSGPHPQPSPEIARAIKAARASGTQMADAGEVLRSLKISLNALEQGE